MLPASPLRSVSEIATRASGSRYGSDASSTPSSTANIATLAPMPSASVASAVAVCAGRAASVRSA